MKLLDKVDRLIRPIAIRNLTLTIIAGQVALYIMSIGNPQLLISAMLVWDDVLQGQVWRLITFLLIPPAMNPIFLFFAFYIFYMMGTSMEMHWGFVRYNTFLWLGTVLTMAAAGIVHDQPVTGAFLEASVFLAFATYNPNFELRLFFMFPVQIKWLALIAWFFYAIQFTFGPLTTKLMVAASIGNYLIFFAPDVFSRLRHTHRRMKWNAKQSANKGLPRHVCSTCGITSNTHPKMDFRYCSKCDGHHGYCSEHLRTHEHVVDQRETADS